MYSNTGIYSLPKASRLVGVPAPKIRRWLYGHTQSRKTGDGVVKTHAAPLWSPQLSKDDYEAEVIGFLDLLEIRFVAAFVSHGVPLQVIRTCLETARTLLKTDHPFASGSFKTDGKTIFAEALSQSTKEGALLDLKNRQFAFKEIIKPSLYEGIEYSKGEAVKWYPGKNKSVVVLDPTRQFGSPIVEDTGVPTDVLFASYLAEGATAQAIKLTAGSYGVAPKHVEAAVRFEQNLRQQTA